MQQSCLGEHRRAKHLVEPLLRDEVNWTSEQLGESVLQVDDLPAEPGLRRQLVEQVDVAPFVGLAAGDRAEDVEPSDAVLSAQFVEAIDIDIEQLGHPTIVPRSGHEGDTRGPESLRNGVIGCDPKTAADLGRHPLTRGDGIGP